MIEKNLHEKFIDYLLAYYPQRRRLISELADILKIERESVYRRLNGKVLFTVDEVGKIIEKLNISMDRLLNKESSSTILSLDLMTPFSCESMDSLLELMGTNIEKLKKLDKASLNIGYIFDSLPIEFYLSYSNLCKFMYFKWGYYFVKENSHYDYASWEVPSKIYDYHQKLIDTWDNYERIFYIWDNPVIWNLVKEIDFFYKMRIIKEEDVVLIKKDLHDLLNNVEAKIKSMKNNDYPMENYMELYVSSINIGVTCAYLYSSNTSLIQYNTHFSQAIIYENIETFNKVYEWINSMKSVSTLISGSGALERRIFFDEQHKIIGNYNPSERDSAIKPAYTWF